MIGDYLQKNSYEYLINNALSKVTDDVDKRQGSIIYDALAPSAYQIADMYMELRNAYLNTSILTAQGEYLDYKVIEQGLIRHKSTKAIKKATFVFEENTSGSIAIGARFSAINEDSLNYKVIDTFKDSNNVIVANTYLVECEIFGTRGNSYTGDLLPISYINNLKSATMSTLITPARDTETDEELRRRFITSMNEKAYAGNVYYYQKELSLMQGVGAVQIYPVHEGGGSVLISVIDTEYNPISQDFINILENKVDPENAENKKGTGLGIAPIGHKVTVSTATKINLDISAKIELVNGFNLEIVKENIKKELENYILTTRKTWSAGNEMNVYSLSIYISRISLAFLNAEGVNNVTDIKVNGSSTDLKLTQTSKLQELPYLGKVDIT